jgi:hypothetical protein
MIPGFELRRQVEAQLAALEHEKLGAMSAQHLASIDQQIDVFTAELERMQATGEGDKYATADKTLGTLGWIGSYEELVPGAKAIPRR